MERDHTMKSHAARKAAMIAAVLQQRQAQHLTTVEELTAALESLAYDYAMVTSPLRAEWAAALQEVKQ